MHVSALSNFAICQILIQIISWDSISSVFLYENALTELKEGVFFATNELLYSPKTSAGSIILILPRLQRETDVYIWD